MTFWQHIFLIVILWGAGCWLLISGIRGRKSLAVVGGLLLILVGLAIAAFLTALIVGCRHSCAFI